MFKFISKFVPNEMIHIPSNKRMKWIHKKVFEKDPEMG